jgi:hypothetical protein
MGGVFKRTAQVAATTAAEQSETNPAANTEANAPAPLPQEQVDQLSASVRRKRKGTSSTITGASAGSTAGSVASKTLLGM